ncbi:MAG: aspartyl/asparaginyl beta-hydroxylase domain-containing protein [Rhodocyclaceae bacterium]|nr:aspartyl/asparaginyl beta-hydroxylase domain-containing protein [Rhodocyclaceae bacterium]
MNSNNKTLLDPKATAQAGFEALRQARPGEALRHFDQLVGVGVADASVYFAMAIAHQRMNSVANALKAIDHALILSGANFQMLLLKADLLAEQGAHREASGNYLAAVRSIPADEQLSPALLTEFERAKRCCDAYAEEWEASIRKRLATSAASASTTTSRLSDAIDILFGHKKVYPQQPRYFHLPGLTAVPFFDPAAFAWVSQLESHTASIRAELEVVMRDQAAFKPYVEGNPNRPNVAQNSQNGMLNNPDWSAFYLWKAGKLVAENAARCPNTVKALEAVPLTRIPNRSPSVLFSLLRPGAHIPPHNGLINTRLIVHLPLIVPGRCRLRVGNETREWQEGKVWLFDDTIEHEAWNDSDQIRVILIFEVGRPDVTEAEHQQIAGVFEALDAHSGQTPEWEI